MDLFSSIKNAYDSIGTEISKTFDSSDFEKEAKGSKDVESLTDSEQSTPQNTLSQSETRPSADQASVYATPSGGKNDEDSWGQWEERVTPTRRAKVMAAESVSTQASPVTGKDVTGKDVTDGELKEPVATSTPAKSQSKGKSSLENLSREDLVKYVKKQALLLQKTKVKCEALCHECEELKKQATPTSSETTPTSSLLEELVIVRSERDKTVGEEKSLRQSLTEMTRENQDQTDQIQALTEANEKLKVFCQEHQSLMGEVEGLRKAKQTASEEKEQLSSEVTLLREEVEGRKQTLSDREATVRELSDRVEELVGCEQRAVEEAQHLREELTELRRKSSQLDEEKAQLSTLVEQLTGKLEEAKGESSLSQERSVEEWREKVEELERCLADKASETAAFEAKLTQHSELKNENETLSKQLSDSKTTNQELVAKLKELEQNNSLLKSQISDTVSRLDSTQVKLESVRDANLALESELNSVRSLDQTQSEKLRVEIEGLKQRSQTLTENTDEVGRLRDECQRLTQSNSELESKLDEFKNQLEAEKNGWSAELEREKEAHKEETKKLKVFVLKLKRELKEKESTSDSDDKALREELEQLRVAMDTIVSEKEELTANLAESEASLQEAQGGIQELSSQLSMAQSREAESKEAIEELQRLRGELLSRVSGLEESGELMKCELSSVQSDLATAQSLVNTQQLMAGKLEQEVSSLQEELVREKQSHSGTKEQLVTAERGIKSSTLMNLELEDYQRSIRSLEEELAAREAKLKSVHEESQSHVGKIQELSKKLESSGALRSQEAETVNKLKALLVKNKKELSESRKKEAELEEKVEELTTAVEREREGAEENKVQLSELSARLHTEQLQHTASVESLESTVRGLELKMATLQSELSSAQASLTIVQGDYDSYKVRVHSVLKQKTSAEQVEINPELKKRYEEEIGRLKTELQSTKSQLSTTLADHEELLMEHDTLTTRHDQLLQDAQTTRERLQLKLKEADSQHSRESREQGELVLQLRQEIEKMTTAFTSQISGLQQEHKKVVVGLREELHSAHSQLSRLQEEADSKVLERAISQESRGVVKTRRELELKLGRSPSETRTSGVGMDRSELESSYPSTPLSREDSSVSLERLLSHSSEAGSLSERERVVQKQLVASGRKVDHLTELLRESEASSLRLSEQAKLLKEEIRRLERNQEREGVANMEYLKNVVLKFLHTRDVKERERLVPVITKLLQLSPQEVKFVQDAIQGDVTDGPPGAAVTSQGVGGATSKLSNYIHRWTGY